MKNITVTLDDETYQKASVVAAQRDSSVTALVENFLANLSGGTSMPRDRKKEQEALLDSIWKRYPNFTSAENVSRDELYER